MTTEFPHDQSVIHLNHAGVGPWPRRAVEAVAAFSEENLRRGSLAYPQWIEVENRLRQRLARLINAPTGGDIALVKNTSEGLSLVAWGLDWRPGDNVVVARQEFPSNRIVWQSLAERGVECRLADLTAAESPEAAITAVTDERTRLISVSAVQYASGLRMDLAVLGAFCQERGILFCVDAIQQIGALPFDARAIHADFVAADGHKWMLGPEGLGFLYCRAELRERIALRQFGWHMVERLGDFEREAWQPANDARRFEAGSPNLLAAHALEASLSLLEEVGMGRIGETLRSITDGLIRRIDAEPELELLSPRTTERRSGIVTFRHRNADHDALWHALMARGVLCAPRGGGLRFSPHFYIEPARLEEAVDAVLEEAKGIGVRG
ncbi:aminotransferase class V-fold PLP-dependent enzyme [Endothiovibrio diazotrophicus]